MRTANSLSTFKALPKTIFLFSLAFGCHNEWKTGPTMQTKTLILWILKRLERGRGCWVSKVSRDYPGQGQSEPGQAGWCTRSRGAAAKNRKRKNTMSECLDTSSAWIQTDTHKGEKQGSWHRLNPHASLIVAIFRSIRVRLVIVSFYALLLVLFLLPSSLVDPWLF